MDISLTPELEKLVQEKIASGLYESANEVIHESLLLLQERDKIREFRLRELKKEIHKGIDQLEQGEYNVYDSESLKSLVEDIKQRGRNKRAEQKM